MSGPTDTNIDRSHPGGPVTGRSASLLAQVLATGGNFGYALAQWFLVWLFARQGGPEGVGQYSGLLAFATPIFIFAAYGLGGVFLTLTEQYAFRTYLILSSAGQVIGVLALLAIGLVAGFAPGLVAAMIVLKLADWAVSLGQLLLRSRLLIIETGAAAVVTGALKIGLAAVAVAATGSIPWGVVGSGVSSLVVLAGILVVLRRPSPVDRPTPAPGGWGPILRAATPVMAGQFLVSLLTYVPVWVAQAGSDPAAVGVYSGASYLVVAANLFGGAQQTVQLPVFQERNREGAGRLLAQVRSSSLRWCAIGLAGAVVAVAAGPAILRFVYGEGFEMSRVQVGILAVAAVLAVPTCLMETAMLVRNIYRGQTLVAVVAVAATAAGGLLTMPLAGPLTAACVATLAGSVTRLVAGWVFVRR